MRKAVFCGLFFILFIGKTQAQTLDVIKESQENDPVEVYGRANFGKGKSESVLLVQPNEENPLGNPIVSPPVLHIGTENMPKEISANMQNAPQNMIQEGLPQNPKISPQMSPQEINKQIQNTLYESGGRIYDIQSYPATDVDYIEEPNLSNTITTYPAY
jgi:hypothetical protein